MVISPELFGAPAVLGNNKVTLTEEPAIDISQIGGQRRYGRCAIQLRSRYSKIFRRCTARVGNLKHSYVLFGCSVQRKRLQCRADARASRRC